MPRCVRRLCLLHLHVCVRARSRVRVCVCACGACIWIQMDFAVRVCCVRGGVLRLWSLIIAFYHCRNM